MAKALFIVDMLHDFVDEDGKLPVKDAKTLIGNIAELKGYAEKNGIPVIYANDAHAKDDPEFQYWPPHAIKGTYGADIIGELKYNKENIIIEKQKLSAFTNPGLDGILGAYNVDEIYVTGVATEYCVRGVTMDALDLGYKVNLVADAIAGVDEIRLPDNTQVPKTKGAVAYALMEMGAKGARPIYTNDALEEMLK